jgi:hypothetical protein
MKRLFERFGETWVFASVGETWDLRVWETCRGVRESRRDSPTCGSETQESGRNQRRTRFCLHPHQQQLMNGPAKKRMNTSSSQVPRRRASPRLAFETPVRAFRGTPRVSECRRDMGFASVGETPGGARVSERLAYVWVRNSGIRAEPAAHTILSAPPSTATDERSCKKRMNTSSSQVPRRRVSPRLAFETPVRAFRGTPRVSECRRDMGFASVGETPGGARVSEGLAYVWVRNSGIRAEPAAHTILSAPPSTATDERSCKKTYEYQQLTGAT